jgi:hypothetical protein
MKDNTGHVQAGNLDQMYGHSASTQKYAPKQSAHKSALDRLNSANIL